MGLLAWLRKTFTHDIVCTEDISKELIYFIPLKNKRIKIDSKVTVKNGYVFAIGYHGKTYDYLPVGTHYLSAVTLPNCSKKFKLYKLDDRGKKKKYFKAEAYYINISTFNGKFETSKIELKDPKYGIYKAQYIGKYNFTVTDYKKLFAAIYAVSSCKKEGEAFETLEGLVNDYLYELLSEANFSVEDNKEYSQKLRTFTSESFQKKIFDFGLTLNSFEITDIIFDKKLMKRLNASDIQFVREDGEVLFENNSPYGNAFHFPETDTPEEEQPKEEVKTEEQTNDEKLDLFGSWENTFVKMDENKKSFEQPDLPKPKKYSYEKYTQSKQEEKEPEKDAFEERKKQGLFSMVKTTTTPYMVEEKKPTKSEKTIRAEKNIEFALFGQGDTKKENEEKPDARETSKSFVNLSIDDNPMFSSNKKKNDEE